MGCDLEELTGTVVIIGDNLRNVAKAAAALARAIAMATIEVGAICAAFEKEELYRTLPAETDKLDPITELLQNLAAMETLDPMTELMGELADDILLLPPPKIPRPPKYLGPVNKANHTASRPPRRARSSCYKRHR